MHNPTICGREVAKDLSAAERPDSVLPVKAVGAAIIDKLDCKIFSVTHNGRPELGLIFDKDHRPAPVRGGAPDNEWENKASAVDGLKGAVRDATDTYTWGFVGLLAFCILCLAIAARRWRSHQLPAAA